MYVSFICFGICIVIFGLIALYKSLCARIESFRNQYDDYNHRLEKFNKSVNNLALAHHHWEEKFKTLQDQLNCVNSNTVVLRKDMQDLLIHSTRLFSDCLGMVYDDAPTVSNSKSNKKWRT